MIESRDEHHRGHGVADRTHDVESVTAWHLHVEEHEIDAAALQHRNGLVAGSALARDRDAILRREQAFDPPARDGFVVHDQRPNHDSPGAARRTGIDISTIVPPPGAAAIVSRASSP